MCLCVPSLLAAHMHNVWLIPQAFLLWAFVGRHWPLWAFPRSFSGIFSCYTLPGTGKMGHDGLGRPGARRARQAGQACMRACRQAARQPVPRPLPPPTRFQGFPSLPCRPSASAISGGSCEA